MTATIDTKTATIHYVDQGDGPILLFVHGFPLDHSMWNGQIETLSEEFRVIALDLPGFGQSIRNSEVEVASMADFADSLVELLTALNIAGRVHFCGLSMGGYIGWEMLERHSHRIDRMILCDTRSAADTPQVARGRELMAASVERDGTVGVASEMIPKLFAAITIENQQDIVASIEERIKTTSPSSIAAAQRGMATRRDFTDQLSSMTNETLLICGKDDTITRVEEMTSIAEAMPAAQFVTIPDAGHLAPLEQPALVNQTIVDFLTKH